MVLEEDVGSALATACGLDCDSDAVYLAHAAQIVLRQMFREAKPFNGFPERCQGEYVPSLARPCEHDSRGSQHQRPDGRDNPAALAVAQILKFNSINTSGHVAHHQSANILEQTH